MVCQHVGATLYAEAYALTHTEVKVQSATAYRTHLRACPVVAHVVTSCSQVVGLAVAKTDIRPSSNKGADIEHTVGIIPEDGVRQVEHHVDSRCHVIIFIGSVGSYAVQHVPVKAALALPSADGKARSQPRSELVTARNLHRRRQHTAVGAYKPMTVKLAAVRSRLRRSSQSGCGKQRNQ